ncbi:hypothetical protein FRC10_002865 [Ceratobasidium sp. 414]|nr:hypothetical protein FRC10_002865 [Ceratobasidium sp. 414]
MLLMDLYLGHYLVGSNRDRQVIEEMWKDALDKCKQQDDRVLNSFVSSQDSRAISRAYASFLHALRRKLASAESLSIDMAGYLGELVRGVVGSDHAATTEELASTIHCALEYFWLLLAQPKEISVENQVRIRLFVSRISSFIRIVDTRLSSSGQNNKQCLAQMFATSDAISLIGRIILLTLNQETEQDNTSLMWHTFFESTLKLKPALDGWIQTSPALFTTRSSIGQNSPNF